MKYAIIRWSNPNYAVVGFEETAPSDIDIKICIRPTKIFSTNFDDKWMIPPGDESLLFRLWEVQKDEIFEDVEEAKIMAMMTDGIE